MSSNLNQKNIDSATRTMILDESVKLLAEKGFHGTTMRDLAKAVGITAGAIYYYFPTKEDLQVATVSYAFKDRSEQAIAMLDPKRDASPLKRLEMFILRLCERFYEDSDFRKLVQRSLMEVDINDNILSILVDVIFTGHFKSLEDCLAELAPDFDKHLLTVSIFGLVMHNYNTRSVRQYLPSHNPQNEHPTVVAKHIIKLLKHGILPNNK